jgi:hypothetical protein
MRQQKVRQGVASIFVVIFTTLLLGIITLSFVRIMVSEANQTTNFDLSQSAYDSALAGIEDAKVALLKYHECLSQGATATSGTVECRRAINAMLADNATENCDIVKDVLVRPGGEGETIIQSESGTEVGASGRVMDQAYTCVKISESAEDYLGKLTQNYRTKIIPIRAADVNRIDRIRLEWYNDNDRNQVAASAGSAYAGMGNGGATTNKQGFSFDYDGTNVFGSRPLTPPVVQFQLIQTDTIFNVSQFDSNNYSDTNQGTLTLRPSSSGTNLIRSDVNAGLAGSADISFNNPVDIRCGNSTYSCMADINIPSPIQSPGTGPMRDDATMFVRLVLPYGEPITSFGLKLYDCPNPSVTDTTGQCTQIPFVGVQARVDSTGRANDLFRRVEARVELVDTYFPFPEFTVNLNGGGGDSIWKNYWVTRNCWTTGPGNRGTSCDNSGEVSG